MAQKVTGCSVIIVSNLKAIQKILFPLDLNADYKAIIPLVQDFAGKFDASILLLYVIPPVSLFPTFYVNVDIDKFEAEARLTARDQMADIIKNFFADFRLETRIETGDPGDRILEVSKEEKIDMIVMGTHGRQGIERAVFGSVAYKVIQAAQCMVVTTRP